MSTVPAGPMTPEQLESALRAIGAERYHDKHPFHHLLHGGKLSKGQVQAWALNRYCYQAAVPRKDAALIARVHDRELRREWLHRIHDHDGLPPEEPGGIERWLVLTDGLGLDRDYVISRKGALAATVFAVESYVTFVREQPLTVAVASSLTELFAPKIHKERIAGMLENYDFIDDRVMAYFKRRLTQAPRHLPEQLPGKVWSRRNNVADRRTIQPQRGSCLVRGDAGGAFTTVEYGDFTDHRTRFQEIERDLSSVCREDRDAGNPAQDDIKAVAVIALMDERGPARIVAACRAGGDEV